MRPAAWAERGFVNFVLTLASCALLGSNRRIDVSTWKNRQVLTKCCRFGINKIDLPLGPTTVPRPLEDYSEKERQGGDRERERQ